MIESSGSRADIGTGYSGHLPGGNSGLALAAGSPAGNGLYWVSAVIRRKEVMRYDDQQEWASIPCTFHHQEPVAVRGGPATSGSPRLGSAVVVPAGELAAGELLQLGDVLGEAAANRLEEVVGELRLRRRRLLGVVDDLLDQPAHRLRQAVEVAVEGAEARQFDQLL